MADPALDARFMAAAIRLGASALGEAWPNPAVGAILVREGRVVGRGRTARGGRPHGEAVALEQAGEAARGATLYVSLEPCSHQGRAGPCADAVAAAGVARVVCPIVDPNPRVAGRGFTKLRGAGVEVEVGRLADEARQAHAGHLRRLAQSRPHVALKLAISADHGIGRRGEARVVVTGPTARRHVHALRALFDAILVGAGTIEADDPELTCRLPGLESRSPLRVVLAGQAALSANRRVLTDGRATWVLGGQADGRAGEVRRLAVPVDHLGRVDLRLALERLAAEGVGRVLVEGGARVARSFVEADLADEIMLFRSPAQLGPEHVPALAGLPLAAIERSEKYRLLGRRRLAADTLSRYERS